MTKPIPLEHDQYYHVYNRGNNRENLFRKSDNYHYFMQLYAKHIEPIAETFAYCLLPNHFHLLVRIKAMAEIDVTPANPLKKPSQYFSNLFNAYTKAFNNAYRRTGALFERPFGRIPVTSDAYFIQLVTYIHQNPQKHNLINDFREWPYSSYRTMLGERPTHVQRAAVLDWFQGRTFFEKRHLQPIDEAYLEPLILEDFD
jgi:REP element-mobilizing transposase RayT